MTITEDRSQEVSAVAGFFLVLSTISIALRCYCRIKVVKNFGWDDWFAVLAYVSLYFIHIISRFRSFRVRSNIGSMAAVFCFLLCLCNCWNTLWHGETHAGHSSSRRPNRTESKLSRSKRNTKEILTSFDSGGGHASLCTSYLTCLSK